MQASSAQSSLVHELPVSVKSVVPVSCADWQECPKLRHPILSVEL